MPLSKKAIENLYEIRRKLNITYKASSGEEQRKRIMPSLKEIESIISKIEEGVEINPDELNLFSDEIKNVEDEKNEATVNIGDKTNYTAKIEIQKINDANKDTEIDQIYSFIMYFEKNFIAPLSTNYLRLEYDLSKHRDTFFNHYDNLRKLLKEFSDDAIVLKGIKQQAQLEQYKMRLLGQKNYFLVKISEFLHEIKEFFEKILKGYKSGINTILNPKEKYFYKYQNAEKSDFEGVEMIKIIEEALAFTEDFIEILRIPDFRKI